METNRANIDLTYDEMMAIIAIINHTLKRTSAEIATALGCEIEDAEVILEFAISALAKFRPLVLRRVK